MFVFHYLFEMFNLLIVHLYKRAKGRTINDCRAGQKNPRGSTLNENVTDHAATLILEGKNADPRVCFFLKKKSRGLFNEKKHHPPQDE